ncbi:MAG TPA: rubrerythrin family protein [Methanocella sp.]|uniref:rubrerythrin family protein n=1 Tax=Methanocella sp. TaxID=2052833 RepID=UPI002CD3DE96|nr:rubrerythrin family protein [Methanocella sp.]HTY92107.1 rubrerythrin family protein [Methanocella sp.]
MKKATARSVRDAFGAESAAHMRYLIFSEQAGYENFPNVARLFRALTFAGQVHAIAHYRQAKELLGEYCVYFSAPFILDRTVDNLTKASEAAQEAGEEFYPPLAAAARSQGEMQAAQSFERIAQVKKAHYEMLRNMLGFIEHAAEEPKIGGLYVCGGCGLVVEGKPPGICPICEAKQSCFRLVS